MGCDKDELMEGTTWSFPRSGFWLVHILGPLLIFMLGIRFATRRVPVIPMLAFRIFRMLRER